MSYIFTNPSDQARTKNKWGMGYYDADVFPFPQGTGGPFQAFPGTPGLSNPPFPIPPVMTCPKPSMGMGMFRPNQAVARGLYSLGDSPAIVPSSVTVDPTLLIGGIALLAGAMFLFGSKKAPAIKRRRIARYRRKIAALEAA